MQVINSITISRFRFLGFALSVGLVPDQPPREAPGLPALQAISSRPAYLEVG